MKISSITILMYYIFKKIFKYLSKSSRKEQFKFIVTICDNKNYNVCQFVVKAMATGDLLTNSPIT